MTPTFETIFEQAKNLPLAERAKLIKALSKSDSKPKSENKKRVEKIRAFRGKFRRILPSVEEFLSEKSMEIELEGRR